MSQPTSTTTFSTTPTASPTTTPSPTSTTVPNAPIYTTRPFALIPDDNDHPTGDNSTLSPQGSSFDPSIMSNISLLFYFLAAVGVACAIFYTVYTARRDRKANRQQEQAEEARREAVRRQEARQPLTYRPNSGDEVSPPEYFQHSLDRPYVGPETMMLYPDEVEYGGRVLEPAAADASSSSGTTETTQQQTSLNNPASAHARSHSRSASRASTEGEVAIDIPTICAPSPALVLDNQSTTLDPQAEEEDSTENNGRRRRRVTFGGHRLSLFHPNRLLHRRGSGHSNSGLPLHRRISTSSHGSSQRNSSVSSESSGASGHHDHQRHHRQGSTSSSEASSSSHVENSAPANPTFQRTSSNISDLIDAVPAPAHQPPMTETTRVAYPRALNRLRSEGPPPYVSDVRPEDAPRLPPDYSAIDSDVPTSPSSSTSGSPVITPEPTLSSTSTAPLDHVIQIDETNEEERQ
ncbi:hypothetical protein BGZ73_008304 [Actinomortierella ambigua]|nr:hypothetical protein BGZ73_008304 [Actinomortierella ambigua]